MALDMTVWSATLDTMKVQGELVRQARQERAWTQEELSHRSGVGLRTIRRLEAGQGSLDSLRRIAEALELEPAECLRPTVQSKVEEMREWLQCDPIRLVMSTSLLLPVGETFIEQLTARIGQVRKHFAREMGVLVPGVRLQDFLDEEHRYRILIREIPRGTSLVHPGRLMAVAGELKGLQGPKGLDPGYGMPVVWIEPDQREKALAQGCLVFDIPDVMMTHLTRLLREYAPILTGVEETAFLLDSLGRPRLVEEVIPKRISLAAFRKVLQLLLSEGVSIRDLALLLEAILDESGSDPVLLAEACRRAVKDSLVRPYADGNGEIEAVVLASGEVDEAAENSLAEMERRGLTPLVLAPEGTRLKIRAALEAHRVVLCETEIPKEFRTKPFT